MNDELEKNISQPESKDVLPPVEKSVEEPAEVFEPEVVEDEPVWKADTTPKKGFKMTRGKLILITLVVILILLMTVFIILPAGVFHYSHGYRLGLIPKFSHKGLIIKTFEGELYYGNESDHGVHGGIKNPWTFTVINKDIIPFVEAITGDYGVAEYNQYRFRNPFKARTKYQLVSIVAPSGVFETGTCGEQTDQKGFSKGHRFGRIVKISRRHRRGFIGSVTKSWEAIIQVGTSGNDLIEMTVVPDISECVIDALNSGKTFDIAYLEKNFKWFSKTKYRIQALTLKEAKQL